MPKGLLELIGIWLYFEMYWCMMLKKILSSSLDRCNDVNRFRLVGLGLQSRWEFRIQQYWFYFERHWRVILKRSWVQILIDAMVLIGSRLWVWACNLNLGLGKGWMLNSQSVLISLTTLIAFIKKKKNCFGFYLIFVGVFFCRLFLKIL